MVDVVDGFEEDFDDVVEDLVEDFAVDFDAGVLADGAGADVVALGSVDVVVGDGEAVDVVGDVVEAGSMTTAGCGVASAARPELIAAMPNAHTPAPSAPEAAHAIPDFDGAMVSSLRHDQARHCG